MNAVSSERSHAMECGPQPEVSIDALPNELLAACLSESTAITLGRAARASSQWHGVAQRLLAPQNFVRIANVVDSISNSPNWETRQVAVQRLCNLEGDEFGGNLARAI